ncbi:hypothetical protein P691DRAFT_791846 [Macrolepiota fuliginosa MF-IS2]|uniref:DUF4100 domain-containing protein n=1 Tax=Macrolepiota fuliginosa MF-IS2 TaxID=1400762 RepID=A0A9P5X0J4_9AGAR|nr:hypothetical protein P691DRAFT_791846 [Macrolepiota fuliginosa MF-IS2]
MPTIQDEEELHLLNTVAVAALKWQEEICKWLGPTGKPRDPPGATTCSSSKQSTPGNANTGVWPAPANIPPTSPSPQQPQYCFSTPIEDMAAVQNVTQQGLDTTFPISVREFLAASPDAQKLVKDQVTTQQIPTANILALEESMPKDTIPFSTLLSQQSMPGPRVVASSIEGLRTIPLVLNEQVMVDAILDEGSQISTIRKDIWEKLALPLMTKETMVMESANAM